MSNTVTQDAPSTTEYALGRGVRIVLFGRTDAGKSSLLGALVQAAQTQQHVLNGSLENLCPGIKELQSRVYQDTGRETTKEVEAYPVTFKSLSVDADDSVSAALIDSNGQVAFEYLQKRQALTGKEGDLADAILNTDALLLIVDASEEQTKLTQDFKEFAVFLRLFEKTRGERSEVGGLPVYLVLTKCDKLAKPNDSPASWIERIGERKRTVFAYFQKHLEKSKSEHGPGFGKIHMNVWATAVRKPALKDQPARPQEPFGVAELFRQVFPAANKFHHDRRKAAHRLGWTVLAMTLIVGLMAAVAAWFLLTSKSSAVLDFETKLESVYAEYTGDDANRLKDASIRKEELANYAKHKYFARISTSLQQKVENYREELTVYLTIYQPFEQQKLNSDDPSAFIADAKQFLEKSKLPAKYKKAWRNTPLVRKQTKLSNELSSLENEIARAVKGFTNLKQSLEKVAKISDRFKYKQAVNDLLQKANNDKHLSKYWISPTENLPNVNRFTYQQVADLDSVRDLIQTWMRFRADPSDFKL